eukprot:SAG31_NODE_2543_length_5534_cov_9.026311_8_plen_165_part_00
MLNLVPVLEGPGPSSAGSCLAAVSGIYFINRWCWSVVQFFHFCDPTPLEKVAKMPPTGFVVPKKCVISRLQCPNSNSRCKTWPINTRESFLLNVVEEGSMWPSLRCDNYREEEEEEEDQDLEEYVECPALDQTPKNRHRTGPPQIPVVRRLLSWLALSVGGNCG